jgi:hypothetical protein
MSANGDSIDVGKNVKRPNAHQLTQAFEGHTFKLVGQARYEPHHENCHELTNQRDLSCHERSISLLSKIMKKKAWFRDSAHAQMVFLSFAVALGVVGFLVVVVAVFFRLHHV